MPVRRYSNLEEASLVNFKLLAGILSADLPEAAHKNLCEKASQLDPQDHSWAASFMHGAAMSYGHYQKDDHSKHEILGG